MSLASKVSKTLLAGCLLSSTALASDPKFEWRLSDWSECSDGCGAGEQTRKMDCVLASQSVSGADVVHRKNLDPENCEGEAPAPPQGAEMKRACFGRPPANDFCTSCPRSGSEERAACQRCATGFDLREGDSCSNSAIMVTFDVVVPTGEKDLDTWQREWQDKLPECFERIVGQAGGLESAPIVSTFAVIPGPPIATSVSARRLRRLAASNPGAAATILASTSVPQGVSAGALSKALQSNFTGAAAAVQDGICPGEVLQLAGAEVLCPGGRKAGPSGSCRATLERSFRFPWFFAGIAATVSAAVVVMVHKHYFNARTIVAKEGSMGKPSMELGKI